MTSVLIAVPMLVAALAQSADRSKESQVPAPSLEGSPSVHPSAEPTTPGDKAFRGLFTRPAPTQSLERHAWQAVQDQKPSAKIVCGMVVIQADPDVDPRFVVRTPADSTDLKIRRIPPPACAD